MNVVVEVGDVLDFRADVLISTANPWLNMSGGVNGAIRHREPNIQLELHEYLKANGTASVPVGSVVPTSAGDLPFRHIVHAVAIDPFYDSSHQNLVTTLNAAFQLSVSMNAKTIAMPALATGYGPLTVEAFALAFAKSVVNKFPIDLVIIVVRSSESAVEIESVLSSPN